MSIADKLIYLNTTKEKLKDSINNIGGSITDDTTFRAYAEELDNIYSNIPKTTGEGSNLSLTTLKGRINVDDILGDTEQDTYEGYNLLPITATSQTISGITITINSDKTITLNGTSTSMLGLDLGHCALVSGSYKGNCETNATTNTYYIRLGEGEGDSSTWIANATNNTTFTLSEDKNVYARLIIRNGVTINNVKIYPMLYSGSTTKPYEQYVGGIASPNPTYPQDINVVTGQQEVLVQNRNLLAGIELGDINSQTGAESTSTSAVRGTNYIRYFTNTDYFPSVNGNLIASGNVVNLRFYNKDKQYIGYSTLLRTGGRNFSITITTSVVDTTPYYFRIRTTTSVATTADNIMISYSSDTTYVEHQEQTKIVNLSSKNLIGLSNGTYSNNGITAVVNNGTITLNGTASGTSFVAIPLVQEITLSNSAITLSTNNEATGGDNLTEIRVYTSGSSYLACSYNTINNSVTYTNKADTYLRLQIRTSSGISYSDFILKPQLEYNSSATTYEPYYNYELSKIGTYQDRISKSSGKNLFDKDTIKEGYLIQVNGKEVANASYGASDYIPIKANTYYTRTNCNNYYGAFYNTNKEFVGAITNANTIISSVDGYARISFLLTNLDSVMLNEGSSALPYEPYGSDKWYIEKNIGKRTLIGASGENWVNDTTYTRFSLSGTIVDYNIDQRTTAICNLYRYGDSSLDNYFALGGNGSVALFHKPTGITSLDNWKTWLATNKLVVVYILAVPTYTEITNTNLLNELNELEKIMSYNGTTNINISGNLPMILDVTALKGE